MFPLKNSGGAKSLMGKFGGGEILLLDPVFFHCNHLGTHLSSI